MAKDCRSCPYRLQAIFKKPTIEQCKEYAQSIGYTSFDAEHFYYYNDARGWCDNKGRPYKRWKSVIHTWYLQSKRRGEIKEQKETFLERQNRNGTKI